MRALLVVLGIIELVRSCVFQYKDDIPRATNSAVWCMGFFVMSYLV
jgi:hypothetical protein